MQLPSQIHKARGPRPRRRSVDTEYRVPFERVPAWLRALSSLPLPVWYAIAACCAWLAEYVARNRLEIIDMQLAACFPDRDAEWVRATRHAFFKRFGSVAAEIVKAATIAPDEIDRRVTLENSEAARTALDAGQSIIVVTSHNCNWEWAQLQLCEVTTMIDWPASSAARAASVRSNVTRRSISSGVIVAALTISAATLPKLL